RLWIGRFIEEQIEEGRGWDIRRELVRLGKEIFTDQFHRHKGQLIGREELQQMVSVAVGHTEKIKSRMMRLAGEALRVLEDFSLTYEDFPYGKSGFIYYFYKVAAGDVWSGYGKRVADALISDEKWYGKTAVRKSDIQRCLLQLKSLLVSLCGMYDENKEYALTTGLLRENFRSFGLLTELAGQVREACDERNVMLISETNRIIDSLIDGNDTPFIFEKAGNHFLHFMIDEFQDTSGAQWRNFLPLLSNAVAQSEEDPVLLVGDVKQSIYRWRGGDWEILGQQVSEAFMEVEQSTLERNFRSMGNIVRFNNQIIRSAVNTADAELNELIEQAHAARTIDIPLRDRLHRILQRAYRDCSQQVARQESDQSGYVKCIQFDKETEGNRELYLIETIENLQRRGYRAGDMAVLVRRNEEAVQIANYLLEYKSAFADSPFCYDVVTQEALVIGNSPAIRFVTACLRLSVNIEDSISRAIFLRSRQRSVAEPLTEREQSFFESLRHISPEEAFQQILLEYRPDREPGSIAYLQAFHDQILSFGSSRISDIPLFLRWWDENGCRESINLPAGQNAITIITIHKSKGLQFPVVILPYANWEMTPNPRTLLWTAASKAPFEAWGPMPVKYKKAMAESAFASDYFRELVYTRVDNLNMLYVALTRAEEELYLMMPRAKRADGSRVSDLLLRSMNSDGKVVLAGDLEGRVTECGKDLIYEWGSPVHHRLPESAGTREVVKSYPTFRFSGKLRLKREARRYRDEETGQWQLSPRQYGRLMHRIFESVSTADQIDGVLERFEREGTISAADRTILARKIDRALEIPQVRQWFEPGWKEIRNENDILVPAHTASPRRPDRVMIRQERVVVVDYKFGGRENNAYARQVQEYVDLIRQMGYTEVQGYIWYVELGKVVPA
ncbi:MAG: UvrD-helicase domain-containing protein, partial [Rikenellaceae bacterium]|nr:UvrD-helicase domain-containing protein [Rikenellaceae bacterium]